MVVAEAGPAVLWLLFPSQTPKSTRPRLGCAHFEWDLTTLETTGSRTVVMGRIATAPNEILVLSPFWPRMAQQDWVVSFSCGFDCASLLMGD